MSYSPQNVDVYESAFAGAMTGMGVSNRTLSDIVSTDYDAMVAVAQAWAELFDIEWGGFASDSFVLRCVGDMTEQVWFGRTPQPITAQNIANYVANFENEISAIIALIKSGQRNNASNGITPTSAGGGWVTVYDVDFTALPNQTIGADGAVAIPNNLIPSSGTTAWSKSGSSGETSPLAIVHGAGNGLTFQPADTGNPTLFTNLMNLLPAAAQLWSTGIRVWVYVTSTNATTGTFAESLADPNSGCGYGISDENGAFAATVSGENPDYVFTQSRTLSTPATLGYSVYMLEIDGLNGGILKTSIGAMVNVPPLAFPSSPYEKVDLFPLTNMVGNLSTANGSMFWTDPTVGAGEEFTLQNIIAALTAAGNAQVGYELKIGRFRVDYKL